MSLKMNEMQTKYDTLAHIQLVSQYLEGIKTIPILDTSFSNINSQAQL